MGKKEKIAARKERDRLSHRHARENETEEQRSLRLERNRSRMRESRMNESLDARNLRLCDKSQRAASARLNESEEERQARLKDMQQRAASARLNESEEDRQARLTDMQQRAASARLTEKEEDRRVRLESMRVRILAARNDIKKLISNIKKDDFAEYVCHMCTKLCYHSQIKAMKLMEKHYHLLNRYEMYNFKIGEKIFLCTRCYNSLCLPIPKLPVQSLANKMTVAKIPDCIKLLDTLELALLARMTPYIKLFRLPGKFGQHGSKGQCIHFAACVEEVIDSLPLRMDECGFVIISESKQNVKHLRDFMVNKENLYAALLWLVKNNHLYKNVQISSNLDTSAVEDIVQEGKTGMHNELIVESHQEEHGNMPYHCFKNLGFQKRSLSASMHQGSLNGAYAGAQCTATAVYALGMTCKLPVEQWTRQVMDEILVCGYRYHVISREENTDLDEDMLSVRDLNTHLNVRNTIYTVNFGNQIDVQLKDLENHLYNQFSIHHLIVLISHGLTVSLFYYDGRFYLFDSHSRTPAGKLSPRGAAVLIEHPNLRRLYSTIKLNMNSMDEYASMYSVFFGAGDDTNAAISNEIIIPTTELFTYCDEDVPEPNEENWTKSQIADFFPSFYTITARICRRLSLRATVHEGNFGLGSSSNGLRAFHLCVFAIVEVFKGEKKVNEWNTAYFDNVLKLGYVQHQVMKSLYSGYNDLMHLTSHSLSIAMRNSNPLPLTLLIDQPELFKLNEKSESAVILTYNDINVLIFTYDINGHLMYILLDPQARSMHGAADKHGAAVVIAAYSLSDVIRSLPNTIPSKKLKKTNVTLRYATIVSDGDEIRKQYQPPRQYSRFDESAMDDVDKILPTVASKFGIDSDEIPVKLLHRSTTAPVNTMQERRTEEFSWYYLFPDGRNGLNEEREFKISATDYFSARLLGQDSRFRRHDYLFYALSQMELEKVKQSTSIVAKSMRVPNALQLPDKFVKNAHMYLKGIRGTNQYWRTYCSELIAMTQNLGPPTWFITLSCNDFQWRDLLKACLIAEGQNDIEPDELTFEQRRSLLDNNPIALCRQYMIRFRKFFSLLRKNDHILGGKVQDYSWRIEFQARGSPHVHMLVWIENTPSFDSQEGIDMINDVIRCDLPDEADDPELHCLVKKFQMHKHTATCYKTGTKHCRFAFPRPASEQTMILTEQDAIRNGGRFYIHKRRPEDGMVNGYNEFLLTIWEANIDIQACTNATVAYYVAKYVGKAEKQHISDVVSEALKSTKANVQGDIASRTMFRIAMKIFSMRELSAPEAAFRLTGLTMRQNSRKTVFVNNRSPEHRLRLIRREFLESAGENEQLFCSNNIEKYSFRPRNLENMSLAEFVVSFDAMKRPRTDDENDENIDERDAEDTPESGYLDEVICLLGNKGRMKRRSRPAILRTVYFNFETNRSEYCYGQLLLHLPHRNEDELIGEYPNAETALFHKRNLLKPLQNGEQRFGDFESHARELQRLIVQMIIFQDLELNAANDKENLPSVQDNDIEEVNQMMNAQYQLDIEAADELQFINELTMTAEEFQNSVSRLNVCQRNIFNLVKEKLFAESHGVVGNPLHIFITGGAGTGKSVVLRTLVELIKRSKFDERGGQIVQVAAPTGVAAKLVNGVTLHKLFHLPIEKSSIEEYKPLTGEIREAEIHRWSKIRWIIIDEISMVSYQVLRMIHLRLTEMKTTADLFGNVNMLVLGDLMQLPPVKGNFIFDQPPAFLHEPHLWRAFNMVELTENMRQQEDQDFVDFLNALRFGEVTADQLHFLYDRTEPQISFKEPPFKTAIRINPTTKLVDLYNHEKTEELRKSLAGTPNKMYKISARDTMVDTRSAHYGRPANKGDIPADINKCGGLLPGIELAVGSRIMLRRNIDLSDGLVNGVLGTVSGFVWPCLRRDQSEEGELPESLLVTFDDESVGLKSRDSLTGSVPIKPVEVHFDGIGKGRLKIGRRMLPIILAWSATVHKMQGVTLDSAVVNLSNKNFAKGQVYVALSRVRRLQGLGISILHAPSILRHPHNEKAYQEMKRLRETIIRRN